MRQYPEAVIEGNIQPEMGEFVCGARGAVICESDCMRVAGHLENFLARQRERGRVIPRFVERELRAFLDCGIPARGFIRVHCDACGLDRVLPYSCKRRGFCPSCGGRRMADAAANLVDRVFPEVPVRQWVMSVPYGLRYLLAYDSSLLRDVLQIFVRAVFASIRRRAGLSASNRRARCGAVTFIQRFSDALNLDPHLHSLALDGIYVEDGSGEPVFRRVPPPSDVEVARVADRVHRRVVRLLQRRGLGPQADPAEANTLWRNEPLLAELYSASVSGRIATGPRAGRGIVRVGDGQDMGDTTLPAGKFCAAVGGFSVHAGVCVPARDRMRLERLARYAGRPPLAAERLSVLRDGRLLYRLKRRWRDGTTHVIYEPLELIERLAALVPPPKFNRIRYSGVLAPTAAFRPMVVPRPEISVPLHHAGCPAAVPKTELGKAGEQGGRRARNYAWAQLMARVFEVDVLKCVRCGGRMRMLAAIDTPDAIRKILSCLGLPTRPPPVAPAMPDGNAGELW
jgi:hypothetical protein